MKIKHYSLFESEMESLIHPDSWMQLRSDPRESAYCIPESAEAYHEKFGADAATPMAEAVIKAAQELGYTRVFSPGCGVGGLEYSVKEHSDLEVSVADYNDSIFRLRDFGIFDSCEKLDLLGDELPDLTGALMLLPRIDTEFTDDQLRLLASKCAGAGASHIFFIPAQMINWKTPLIEFKIWLKALLGRSKRTYCGYSRTKGHLIKLFSEYYECEAMPVAEVTVLMFRKKGERAR